MGSPYDFKIDTLEFRAAIKDDTPYARSTAPFRKDQVDTAQNVGDNSLTGWWTRSQFSFHEGAGIKYYDIEGSSEVLDRFQNDSSGLDPWTPGQVTLAGENWTSKTVPSNINSFSLWGSSQYSIADLKAYKNGVLQSTGEAYSVAQHYCSTGSVIIDLDNAGATVWTNTNTGNSTADQIWNIFVAKNRFWAVAHSGDWFNLPLDGGTIPAGGGAYLFWNSDPPSVGSPWLLAESPGAVYLARGRYVYSVTASSDGSVPSSAAPVVVADLGESRVIKSIVYCRGYLGIVADVSFQVAAIGGDGSLTLGPEYITYGESNCRKAFSLGDKMYFTATDGTVLDIGRVIDLYEVNTSRSTGTLEPAWQKRVAGVFPFPSSGPGQSFCVPYGTDVVVASSGSTVAKYYGDSSSAEPSGYFTTGFHRLGTMDDKVFHEVQVSVAQAPTGQNIGQRVDVFRVSLDGGETFIGSAYNGKYTFSLGDVQAEAIALKFILQRGTDGYTYRYTPVLLGYQIRAQPSPKRERLLKWPLQLTDTWRDRYGQGHGRQGRAWEDLQALEALESSKAIVPFEDYRTGETGSAYIDSVEFQSDTPSTPTSNGFGGIAYVQLRVIGS